MKFSIENWKLIVCFYIVQVEHRTGLEPLVIAAIPTMKYNLEAFQSKDDAQ
jgi:hypothetical protein